MNFSPSLLATSILALCLTACQPRQGTRQDTASVAAASQDSLVRIETRGVTEGKGSLCGLSWGIPMDAFTSTTDHWLEAHRIDGTPTYAGMRLGPDPVHGEFDSQGHLVAYILTFEPFVIGEQPDYTAQEKAHIRQLMARHNQLIDTLIGILSHLYGTPAEQHFAQTDTDFYLHDGTTPLTSWQRADTRVDLQAHNLSQGSGCQLTLRILVRRATTSVTPVIR